MPITEKTRYRYHDQRDPKCPYCGWNLSDLPGIYSDRRHKILCPHCIKEFTMVTELEYRFSTDFDENIKEAIADE